MKTTELMIGDWVMVYPWDETPWKPKKITDINFHSWEGSDFCDSVGVEGWDELSLDQIKPIPLTPEILEKNDFEKQWQDNYEYFNDDENLNITFHPKSSNYTNGAYDYIDIEKGCLTINEMPIAFVHELQHALRLCESKKEIIL